MGLSVNYRLRALASCDSNAARRLVECTRRSALNAKRDARVDDVHEMSDDPEDLARFACGWLMRPMPGDPDTTQGIEVKPEEGAIFPVIVGKGCEPLWLGLCRFPPWIEHQGARLRTSLGNGWSFRGACKTQYASLQGWDHFVRCHTAVVDLLAGWRRLGVMVRMTDEGAYWPRRSLNALRRKLDEMNSVTAAVAGALRDAADDDASEPGGVESPIFRHAHFERLEADGVARHGAKIKRVLKTIQDMGRPMS